MNHPLIVTTLVLALTSSHLGYAQQIGGDATPAGEAGVPAGEQSSPPPAEGQSPAESEEPPLVESLIGQAKAEYAAARILYDDGDYAGALTKLEVAYRLSGDPRLLWNMAAAEKNQRHYARVVELIRRFLASDSPVITAADRRQAELLVDTVQGFVSNVSFDVQPPGSLVTVDQAEIGRAPLPDPVPLDFGRRSLRVELEGYVPHEQTLQLEGGRATSVAVRLAQEANQGALRVVTDPRTTIRIDGRVMGVGLWEGVLPAGAHAIALEGKGKVSQTTEVVIQKGESRTLNIQLRDEVQKGSGAVPTWIWVSGGVVAATALGVGAYFLLHEDEKEPAVERGTWGTLEF